MTIVTGGLELVVQLAQFLCSLHIDRVLLAKTAGLVSGNEAKETNVLGKLSQGEIVLFVAVEIEQTKAGKVGNQHIAGQVALFQAGEVIEGLAGSPLQILAARLVLDQHHPFPEQVDETALTVALLDWRLKGCHPATGDAKDIEEAIPEALRFGIFRTFCSPLATESQGAVTYFIPGNWHCGSNRKKRTWFSTVVRNRGLNPNYLSCSREYIRI